MRKVILSILLAGAAATPAIAQPPQEDVQSGRQAVREARQQEHQQAREQRSDGARNVAPARQQEQHQAQPQAAPQAEVHQGSRGNWDRSRFGGQANTAPQQVVEQQQVQQQQVQRGRRNFDGQATQTYRNQSDGSWARDRGSWSRNRDGDLRQRQTDQQQQQARTGTWSGRTSNQYANNNTRWSGNWNRNWRNDSRYDWRRYRNSHRSLFSLGIYYDPFGYGYRSFDIGYRFQPAYFGQQYWIDPALYGLPYPPPGTQWVRYWDDAVLLDMYSGQVVDVIRGFFW